VHSGSVTLHRNGEELETVEEGGIFGELALVDGGVRSASATAATDAEIVPVDEARFHRLVQETPYFAQAVMRVLVRASPPHLRPGPATIPRPQGGASACLTFKF
jgi:CRP-like cAMP-binding protein